MNQNLKETGYQQSLRPQRDHLKAMVESNNLSLIKTKETRCQGTTEASTLDLIITTNPEKVYDVQISPSCSDHAKVCFSVRQNQTKRNAKPRRMRSYKTYSAEKMR